MFNQAPRLATCLLTLLAYGAGFHTERDMSELGELSNAPADHFISPKRGHEVELKESAGLTNNPKCPPSAFPNAYLGEWVRNARPVMQRPAKTEGKWICNTANAHAPLDTQA